MKTIASILVFLTACRVPVFVNGSFTGYLPECDYDTVLAR
jgi:hypothetical protein